MIGTKNHKFVSEEEYEKRERKMDKLLDEEMRRPKTRIELEQERADGVFETRNK